MLMRDGVDIETISYLLGHESVDNSMPYLEPLDEDVRLAFERAL